MPDSLGNGARMDRRSFAAAITLGSAAALFGASQFIVGAAVAPIVGAAGASAVPMGIVMAVSGVAAMVIGRTITRARD